MPPDISALRSNAADVRGHWWSAWSRTSERIEEAEVSFRRVPLDEAMAVRAAPALSDREAAAQVMEEISLMREGAQPVRWAPLPAQTFLSRTIGGRGFG